MLTYRLSVDATLNFSVQAENENEALDLARKAIADWPECYEIGGPNDISCYPDPTHALEIETSFPGTERPEKDATKATMVLGGNGWDIAEEHEGEGDGDAHVLMTHRAYPGHVLYHHQSGYWQHLNDDGDIVGDGKTHTSLVEHLIQLHGGPGHQEAT